MVVITAAVSATAWIAVASHSGTTEQPGKPGLAQPGQRYGDDADLMRRLERHKLVGKQK